MNLDVARNQPLLLFGRAGGDFNATLSKLRFGVDIKCSTVIDDYSRESVQIGVDFGINAGYVMRLLDQAAQFRSPPKSDPHA